MQHVTGQSSKRSCISNFSPSLAHLRFSSYRLHFLLNEHEVLLSMHFIILSNPVFTWSRNEEINYIKRLLWFFQFPHDVHHHLLVIHSNPSFILLLPELFAKYFKITNKICEKIWQKASHFFSIFYLWLWNRLKKNISIHGFWNKLN